MEKRSHHEWVHLPYRRGVEMLSENGVRVLGQTPATLSAWAGISHAEDQPLQVYGVVLVEHDQEHLQVHAAFFRRIGQRDKIRFLSRFFQQAFARWVECKRFSLSETPVVHLGRSPKGVMLSRDMDLTTWIRGRLAKPGRMVCRGKDEGAPRRKTA